MAGWVDIDAALRGERTYEGHPSAQPGRSDESGAGVVRFRDVLLEALTLIAAIAGFWFLLWAVS